MRTPTCGDCPNSCRQDAMSPFWPTGASAIRSCLPSLASLASLEQYEAAFRENDVDAEMLPTLTGEELKDIGVSSLGHRRRLLEAIANLQRDGASSQAAKPSGDHPASIPADDDVSHSGERRQLTVMFCDLVACLRAVIPNLRLRLVILYQTRASTLLQIIGRGVRDGDAASRQDHAGYQQRDAVKVGHQGAPLSSRISASVLSIRRYITETCSRICFTSSRVFSLTWRAVSTAPIFTLISSRMPLTASYSGPSAP